MAVDASGLLRSLDELARGKIQELADELADEARATAQRRTGAMAEGVRVSSVGGSFPTYTAEVISEAEHGVFQEFGTGIYAGGGRIYPTSAKALAFDWPAGGGSVFFKSVAGTPPTRWWSRAIQRWPEIVNRVSR